MSNRSSIFSFDTIQDPPKPNRVFFLVVIISLFFGVFISINRQALEKLSPRAESLTPVLSYLELHHKNDAEVVFLGSSRFVSCIKTDYFAQLSGTDPSKVINLSVDAGGTWESLLISRKNPQLFTSSPLVIVEIEPWMFNKNLIHPVHKKIHPFEPYFNTWASLRERLELSDIKTVFTLVADYIWPLRERRTLIEWGSALYSIAAGRVTQGSLSVPTYHYSINTYKQLANDSNFSAKTIAQYGMNDFEFAEHKAAYLKRLLDLAQKKTDRIVLLQPPVRKEYMDVIYDNPEHLSTYKEMLAFIHRLENETTRFIICETPQDCGLDDSVFIDYGHFNIKGAYVFTQILYNRLKETGWVKVSDAPPNPLIDNAIKQLLNLLKTNPESHELLYKLGILYEKKGYTGQAMEQYQKAIIIKPDYTKAIFNLCILYANNGYYEHAQILSVQLIKLEPDNPDVYYNLACIQAKLNSIDKSLHWLKKAIDKGFNNWELLKTDKDLNSIRSSTAYKNLLKGHGISFD